MAHTEKTVLFLCTGNHYRSRFAEILFDSVARKLGLPWRASSKGLAWSGASTISARWRQRPSRRWRRWVFVMPSVTLSLPSR